MSCWNSRRRSTHLRHIHCITVAEAAYNKPECAQESSRVHMLIANKKKKKKKREVACSDVPTSQCCSGESIDTTLFGQYDRQTGLNRTFYFVHFWSLEDTSRVQKHTEMEKTGRNSLIILKFVNFRFRA